MATVEATATEVAFVDSCGLRVMRWELSTAPFARVRRECASLAECRALRAEVEAAAVASGRSCFTSMRLVSGRKPPGFDKVADKVEHDVGAPGLAAA